MFIIIRVLIAAIFTWQMNKERVNCFLWIDCNIIVEFLYRTYQSVSFFYLQISAVNVDLGLEG